MATGNHGCKRHGHFGTEFVDSAAIEQITGTTENDLNNWLYQRRSMMGTILRQLVRDFLLYLAEKAGEPLVKASVPKDLRRAMPGIYKELDKKMVNLLVEAGPVAMTSAIGNLISIETGREAELSDIKAVVREYSPVLATLKNISGLYQRDQQQP